MDNWIKAFPIDQFPAGARRVVKMGARKVLVLHIDGEIYAVDNNCPHMRFPLESGQVTEDCGIVCPFHHSAFDLKTGDVKEWSPWPPGIGAIAGAIVRKRALSVFATRVEDGFLYVSSNPKRDVG